MNNIKKLYHKVVVNIADRDGNKKEVLRSYTLHLPAWIAKTLLRREKADIYILFPGESVKGVCIEELPPQEDGAK